MFLADPKRRQYAIYLLAALPFLFLNFWVGRNNHDIPFSDEWMFFQRVVSKNPATFLDLWRQHAEHHSLFSHAWMLLLARLSDWDVRLEVVTNLVLGLFSFLLIFRRMEKHEQAHGTLPLLLWAFVPLLFFSLRQWENWIWGIQVSVFMQVLAVLGGFLALERWQKTGSYGMFALAALCGLIATLTFAAGAAYWPAALPFILFAGPKHRWKWTLLWLAATALTVYLHLCFYAFSDPMKSIPWVFENQLLERLKNLCRWLASPLILSNELHALQLGFAGLSLCWLRSVLWLVRREPAHFFMMLQWYAIAVGLLMVMTRPDTFASRYTTFSLLLWLGLAISYASMMRGKRWQKITYLAALSACLLLALNTGVRSIPLLNKHGDDLVAARDYVLEHPEGPWPRDKAGKLHMAATDNLYIWLPMMAERKLSFYRHLP